MATTEYKNRPVLWMTAREQATMQRLLRHREWSLGQLVREAVLTEMARFEIEEDEALAQGREYAESLGYEWRDEDERD